MIQQVISVLSPQNPQNPVLTALNATVGLQIIVRISNVDNPVIYDKAWLTIALELTRNITRISNFGKETDMVADEEIRMAAQRLTLSYCAHSPLRYNNVSQCHWFPGWICL